MAITLDMKAVLLFVSIVSILLSQVSFGNSSEEPQAGVEIVEKDNNKDTRFNLHVLAKFPYVTLRIKSVEVVRCGADSYQSKIGIKVDDQITMIAGTKVVGMKLKDLRQLILDNVENEAVSLVISREESDESITIIADFNHFVDKYKKFPKHFPRPENQ